MAKFSMWVTRAAMRAKVAVTKVRHAVASTMDAGKEGKASLYVTQKRVPTPDEVCLLGVERYLGLLKDFVPLEGKEEAEKTR